MEMTLSDYNTLLDHSAVCILFFFFFFFADYVLHMWTQINEPDEITVVVQYAIMC